MARYTAEQIYAFAREAGFAPDQAATMTAVALAESRGQSGAHNPNGEDSRGLWQINVAAHTDKAGHDLYDPAVNAKAAFEVSHGGADISPWTTTHGGLSARYLRFRHDAEAAAVAYGDGPGLGMWSGTSGYGDRQSAGHADPHAAPPHDTPKTGDRAAPSDHGTAAVTSTAEQPAPEAPHVAGTGEEYGIPLETPAAPVDTMTAGEPTAGTGAAYGIPLDGAPAPAEQPPATQVSTETPSTSTGPDKTQAFLDTALAQTGDRYVFGHEVKLDDPNPGVFDCSELVQWTGHQVGVELPDGAIYQYKHLQDHLIPVEQAIHTPGALLFSFSSDPNGPKPSAAHVAISLGNGKTIEAKGTEYGVGSWEANSRRFHYAAVIPGLAEHPPPAAAPPPPPAQDAFAARVATDPAPMDANPSALQASQQLTAAEAHPEPQPAPIDPIGDVDHDGVDDALASATASPDFPVDDPDHHPDHQPHHHDDHFPDHDIHDAPGAH